VRRVVVPRRAGSADSGCSALAELVSWFSNGMAVLFGAVVRWVEAACAWTMIKIRHIVDAESANRSSPF
jgi:hypothetical protein